MNFYNTDSSAKYFIIVYSKFIPILTVNNVLRLHIYYAVVDLLDIGIMVSIDVAV